MNANYTVNKILIDYFSFIIKDVEPEEVISMLGFDGLLFMNTYGLHGYKSRYMYDGVSIHYNSSRGDVWCEMTGQGCRVYESYGNNDWFGLAYQIIVNENAHMTRIDVAYDDFNGLLDLDKIRSDVHSGQWVSRCKTITETTDFDLTGLKGSSIMCGQRGSNLSCRIYDKAQERNRADEISHWVRCELQIRHKHADNFIHFLLCDNVKSVYGVDIDVNNRLDALYFAVLNHFIRFIDVNSNDDSNRWRKPCAAHWAKFIDSYHGNGISLYSAPGVEYNILRLRHICEEQYGGLIFTYIQIFGKDQLEDFVQPKSFKLNKKYQYLIDQDRLLKQKAVS